ncbi:glycosyl hydrolase [Micromonospora palythoicola]|uniref:glycosyl hydrolase n=1 Tax=Micromonospora palythoicola TaxID=3120507 RepID=UPI002FCE5E5D
MAKPVVHRTYRSLTVALLSSALLLTACAQSAEPRGQSAAAPVLPDPPGATASPSIAAPNVSAGADISATSASTPTPSRADASSTSDASTDRSPSSQATPRKPVTVVSSARKGVGVWNFEGAGQALANSGAGWFYTWGTGYPGVTAPRGASFVPMIWGAASVTTEELARAKAAGPYLLGFNEPDMAEQSNMSVERALELWPRLMATGSTLGSPAVAWGGADPGGWLDRFMAGAKERGYRVDFITLHWYGGDFTTANAVDQLRRYVEAVHRRYGKPIWLTEFALIRFDGGGQQFPSQAQQAAFLSAATKMLAGLSYVQRYAWFGLPATDRDRSGLFRTGTQATAVGRAFQAAR